MPHKKEGLSSTVFVRSLPYDALDSALEEHFSEVGPVRRAFIVKDRGSQQGRGFGFVTFALPEDAQQAVSTMNGSLFQGRKITLDLAKEGAQADASAPKRKPGKPAAAEGAASTDDAAAPPKQGGVKPARRPTNPKQCRLIVRNLSFKADEARAACRAPPARSPLASRPARLLGRRRCAVCSRRTARSRT